MRQTEKEVRDSCSQGERRSLVESFGAVGRHYPGTERECGVVGDV